MGIKKRSKHAHLRNILIALIAVVVVCFVALNVYFSDYYPAGTIATQLSEELASTGELVETTDVIKVGNPQAENGIILYPGAKVEPHAYVPLAKEFADRGYYCVIEKMPYNFAFFGINRAQSVIDEASGIKNWYLAGHSLGGVAASLFAAKSVNELEGIIYLASYSVVDLSSSGLLVESIYGSEDGVLNKRSFEKNADNLPEDTHYEVILGGNHAGCADYGSQEGDGTATITAQEQWRITVELVDSAIKKQTAPQKAA